jgi:hypothetical protein
MPQQAWPQPPAVCDAASVTPTDGPAADEAAAAQPGSAAAAPGAGVDAEGTWRALLVEAATKSDLVWVRPPTEQRAWPAWHVWHDGAVHVVSGGGEQPLPQLDGPVELLVRSKDTWQRLLTLPADATPLRPDDARWAAAATALAAARLNAAVPPAQLPQVWRDSATITRIDATGPPTEQPGDYDDSSHAAPPPGSPATRLGWRPWHAGGRRRRRRG